MGDQKYPSSISVLWLKQTRCVARIREIVHFLTRTTRARSFLQQASATARSECHQSGQAIMDTWTSPAEWVQFVRECIDDIQAWQRLFGRTASIIVIRNRWSFIGSSQRTRRPRILCVTNDNGWE